MKKSFLIEKWIRVFGSPPIYVKGSKRFVGEKKLKGYLNIGYEIVWESGKQKRH